MFLDKLKNIFSGKSPIEAIADIADRFITTPDEKRKFLAEAEERLAKREADMRADLLKEYELETADRDSARKREAEFVKATGHFDWMMWFLAVSGMAIFGFLIWSVVKGAIPDANRELVFHIFGIIEGVVMSMFTYYFGSSAGSRFKDMKKTP